VLVVEDESDTRDLVGFVLEQHGATAILTETVTQALEIFRNNRPDVIVADIGIPGYNGYALIAAIRKEEGRQSLTPAIALTAYATPADRDTALMSGFNEYISKPFDPGHLVTTIRRLYDEYLDSAA
jgi:CheY-like chemotaxis protein